MIRAILDTNIIISAIFWDNVPEQVYQLAGVKFVLIASGELTEELRDVLARPKFKRVFDAIQSSPEKIFHVYLKSVEMINFIDEAIDIPQEAVRDANDRPVLACAIIGKADYIVTGDNDLLEITGQQYQGIKIVTAGQFLKILTA